MNRLQHVFCVYCTKWNRETTTDHCKVEIIPGKPELGPTVSKLNEFGYCVYYDEAGLARRLFRNLRFGIPRDTNTEFYYKYIKKQ